MEIELKGGHKPLKTASTSWWNREFIDGQMGGTAVLGPKAVGPANTPGHAVPAHVLNLWPGTAQ